MTKREAAIVSAYTGYLIGEFSTLHEYAEKIMGRPVFTHEFGSLRLAEALRRQAKIDFVTISITDE